MQIFRPGNKILIHPFWISLVHFVLTVLWIRDILVRIRIQICGSVSPTYGFGFFWSVAFRMPIFERFFAYYYFLLVHLHQSSVFKDKKSYGSHKTVERKVFRTFFAWWWKDPGGPKLTDPDTQHWSRYISLENTTDFLSSSACIFYSSFIY